MTGRVEGIGDAVRALSGSALLVDEELCVNLRGRHLQCQRCSNLCNVKALDLSPDSVELDEEKCTGCGACVPTCPVGALRLTGFVPQRFVDALAGSESAHIHCARSRDGGGGVVIPCHQLLDARLAAAARANGTRFLHLHGLDQCSHCERGDAQSTISNAQAVVSTWLGDEAPALIPTQGDAAGARKMREREDQVRLSRRKFLRFAGARAATGAAEWFVAAAEDDAESDPLPFFQGGLEARRPAAYQEALAASAERLPWQPGAFPWRARRITDDCTGCQSCGTRCPTGALRARETDDAVTITFLQKNCTDCGLCESICPSGALLAADALPAALAQEASELVTRTRIRCAQCGHAFIPHEGAASLCHICQSEAGIDAEWLAMLQG